MTLFIFGSNGMLGRTIFEYLKSKGHAVVGLRRDDYDISSLSYEGLMSLATYHKWAKGDWVVNAAGAIPQVYSQSEDPHTFVKVNSVFPHMLHAVASMCGAKLFHVTTDCVYSGKLGPYEEGVPHDEKSIYGVSKSCGEPREATILRTSILGEEAEGSAKASLLEWVRTNSDSSIGGFTTHMWNGITCLEVAKIFERLCVGEIQEWSGVKVPRAETVSKFDIVSFINEVYELGKTIVPRDVGVVSKVIRGPSPLVDGIHDTPIRVSNLKQLLFEQKNFWEKC